MRTAAAAATAATTAAAAAIAPNATAGAASAGAAAVASSSVSAAGRRVCFLTDVEGSWSYVRHFVRQSSCLLLAREEGSSSSSSTDGTGDDTTDDGTYDGETLQLRDDCVLVFGGDAGDKGDDTLRCYEQLVRLKKRHPERVVLLVGNRDVNKMRLTSELADSELELNAMAREVHDGPLWVPPDRRVTIADFLARQVAGDATATVPAPVKDADAHAALLRAANTKVNRLKWMLEHTMGAQGDFERRRRELAARAAAAVAAARRRSGLDPDDDGGVVASAGAAAVDDESVLRSYVESVREGGVVREYLELGSLAFIAHGTLFTHGGLLRGAGGDGESDGESESALGCVPGRPSAVGSSGASSASSGSRPPSAPSASSSSSQWSSPSPSHDLPSEQRRSEVAEWVQELNAWYRQQVQEWIEQPAWSADRSRRGGSELLRYVLPDHPASVVMGRHLQASGMPAQLPDGVAQALSASGIRRVVVGHTPHGTCPTVIKQTRGAAPQSSERQQQQTQQTQQSQSQSSSTLLQASTCAASPSPSPSTTFEEVIMCDTSYSDMAASDNRGVAAAELVVEADGRARVRGVLPDGRAVAYASDDPLIGRALRDGTQVKAKLLRAEPAAAAPGDSAKRSMSRSSGATSPLLHSHSHSHSEDEYLVYSVTGGFSYTYHLRTRAELAAIGFAD